MNIELIKKLKEQLVHHMEILAEYEPSADSPVDDAFRRGIIRGLTIALEEAKGE